MPEISLFGWFYAVIAIVAIYVVGLGAQDVWLRNRQAIMAVQ